MFTEQKYLPIYVSVRFLIYRNLILAIVGILGTSVTNIPKDRNAPPEPKPIPAPIATQVPSQCDTPNRSQLYLLHDTIVHTTNRTKM